MGGRNVMKKLQALMLIVAFIFFFQAPTAKANPQELQEDQITGEAAVLMDAKSGTVLFSKNQDERLYPASITKVMTALLAFEKGNLDDVVTADNSVYRIESGSSIIGLKPNEQMTLHELLYGLLLESGNDAAAAIAVHIGGSVDGFADMMNAKVKELGLSNSHFVNPHGLHSDDHYTSAYDMAVITREAQKYPEFNKIVSSVTYKKSPTNICPEQRTWINSNRLIKPNDSFYYEYATGVKTGYTTKSQHTLIASGRYGDMELIAVVLKDSKDGKWIDCRKMLEYGFENYSTRKLFENGDVFTSVTVKNASTDDSSGGELDLLVNSQSTPFVTIKKTGETITQENSLNPEITAPIQKGQVLGKVTFKVKNESTGIEEPILSVDLIASRDVAEKKSMTIKDIAVKNPVPTNWWWWLIPLAAVILGLLSRIVYVRRKRKKRRLNYYYYNRK